MNFTAGRTYQVNVNINWPMLLKIGQTPNWEFNLEIIGPGTAKITEQVLQSSVKTSITTRITSWLDKVLGSISKKDAVLSQVASIASGVQLSQLNKNTVNAAFTGANYNIQVPDHHSIVSTAGNVVCQNNSCKCWNSCAVRIAVNPLYVHSFSVDYKLL